MSKKVTVNVGAFDVPPHEVYKVPIGLTIPGAREPNSIDLIARLKWNTWRFICCIFALSHTRTALNLPSEKEHHDAELGLGVLDENIDSLPSIIQHRQTTEKTRSVTEPERHLALRLAYCLYERYDLRSIQKYHMGTVQLSKRAIARAAKEIAL